VQVRECRAGPGRPDLHTRAPSRTLSPSPVPARARHRNSQSAPLPCPARPCWPPSQPVIHYVRAQHGPETHNPGVPGRARSAGLAHPSSVTPVLATVTASQPLSRAQPALAGHRHSQSFTTSVPSTGLKPELRQGRTDVVNLYIRLSQL